MMAFEAPFENNNFLYSYSLWGQTCISVFACKWQPLQAHIYLLFLLLIPTSIHPNLYSPYTLCCLYDVEPHKDRTLQNHNICKKWSHYQIVISCWVLCSGSGLGALQVEIDQRLKGIKEGQSEGESTLGVVERLWSIILSIKR